MIELLIGAMLFLFGLSGDAEPFVRYFTLSTCANWSALGLPGAPPADCPITPPLRSRRADPQNP